MSQGLLFSEPTIAETGVWCELSEEIDPAQWAGICRKIGRFSLLKFELLKQLLRSTESSMTIEMVDSSRKTYVQPTWSDSVWIYLYHRGFLFLGK